MNELMFSERFQMFGLTQIGALDVWRMVGLVGLLGRG